VSVNRQSFTQFCEDIGVPLRNSRWSWSAINPERRKAIFTIWDNEIFPDGRTYELWNGAADDQRTDNGAREIKRILIEAVAENYDCYGIRCFPQFPLTVPRKRVSYDENNLISLQVEKIDEKFVATFRGLVDSEIVRLGGSIPDAMLGSALDDLDDAPLGNASPPRVPYQGTFIVRDERVRKAVLKRAKGRCEHCGDLGFEKPDGSNYVETHHILSLAEQGPDTLDNVIALCPNHHREAHYGTGRLALEAAFLERLEELRATV